MSEREFAFDWFKTAASHFNFIWVGLDEFLAVPLFIYFGGFAESVVDMSIAHDIDLAVALFDRFVDDRKILSFERAVFA